MFAQGNWCKVWSVEDKGKTSVARISTSRKNDNGEYETDWSDSFVRLVGNARNVAEGDRKQIGRCGVTNRYDKEKKVTYTNYVIFDWAEGNESTSTMTNQKESDDFVKVPSNISSEELPFN